MIVRRSPETRKLIYAHVRKAGLAVYAQAREAIADQLGADPGPDLRQLHLRLLAGDPPPPAVSPAVNARSTTAAVQPSVPRQLPGGVRPFAGRTAELRLLSGLLEEAACDGGSVLISAIGGTAGVGKTTLALHWAHQVADRFPDGQLYVNLRGYDLEQPMPAADALAGFLRALGVPGPDIPPGTEERAARYRSLLAGRRVLVLLDNAAEVEQVRSLLPGTPGSVAVVTSRDALAGLVAREGAQRLDVDLLPLADAVSLLRTLIGERAAADPAAAAGLAERCCRLPLALRVAAELAAARPGAPVSELVAELADRQRRLDLLEAGADPRTAVRAVFSWSCRHLDPGAVRTFRLVGLNPGADLDPYAAAALTGSTVAEADQVLGQLARAHLIHTTGLGRYGMHDLLRAYAAGQATAHDGLAGQQAALTALFDHYLHTAAVAMDSLYPAERHRRPRIARPESPVPSLADPAAARAWLDTERDNLVAVATYTAACGWLGHTTRLAAILARYLDTGGHYPEAITIHSCACRAARDAGDQAAEAQALSWFGGIDWRQGRYPESAGNLRLALALFREIGDRTGEASVLGNLGIVDFQQGRYPQAAGHHRQALALFRETGNRTGEARTLNNLGDVELRQGRYPQAAGHHRQALALCREFGDRLGEAHVLASLGIADWRQGCYPQAADHLRQALALFRETGDRAGEADVLNNLGEVLLATGQPGHARTRHAAALGLASQTGDKYQQARAHHGLGSVHHADDDPGQARGQWEQALTLYASLGTPEANDVRAQLGIANTTAQLPARTKSRFLLTSSAAQSATWTWRYYEAVLIAAVTSAYGRPRRCPRVCFRLKLSPASRAQICARNRFLTCGFLIVRCDPPPCQGSRSDREAAQP